MNPQRAARFKAGRFAPLKAPRAPNMKRGPNNRAQALAERP